MLLRCGGRANKFQIVMLAQNGLAHPELWPPWHVSLWHLMVPHGTVVMLLDDWFFSLKFPKIFMFCGFCHLLELGPKTCTKPNLFRNAVDPSRFRPNRPNGDENRLEIWWFSRKSNSHLWERLEGHGSQLWERSEVPRPSSSESVLRFHDQLEWWLTVVHTKFK